MISFVVFVFTALVIAPYYDRGHLRGVAVLVALLVFATGNVRQS